MTMMREKSTNLALVARSNDSRIALSSWAVEQYVAVPLVMRLVKLAKALERMDPV